MRKTKKNLLAVGVMTEFKTGSSQIQLTSILLNSYSLLPTYTPNICSSIPKPITCLFFILIIFKYSSTLSPNLLCSPFFLITSTVTVTICLAIRWFCILLTWPNHLSWSDVINFTISSFCPYLLVYSHFPAFSFYNMSTYFPYNPPFKYSECVRFFHSHYPSFWPISQCRSCYFI